MALNGRTSSPYGGWLPYLFLDPAEQSVSSLTFGVVQVLFDFIVSIALIAAPGRRRFRLSEKLDAMTSSSRV